jgi:sulfonate transport system substrate-binding protein
VEDLAAMLRSQAHSHQFIGADLMENLRLYAEELKLVGVFQPDTDTKAFATKIYADVLS